MYVGITYMYYVQAQDKMYTRSSCVFPTQMIYEVIDFLQVFYEFYRRIS